MSCTDHIILISIGLFSYLLDIYVNFDKYTNCITNIKVQFFHLFHHIFFVFTELGWISNNFYILLFNIIIIPSIFIHWKLNNNKCSWTQYNNKQCNTTHGLRHIAHVTTNFSDPNRKYQKIYLTITWFIILYKLLFKSLIS